MGIANTDFFSTITKEAAKAREPVGGTFELTARCNLRCRMCYVRANKGGPPRTSRKELSASEWIRLARDATESGLFFVVLTGGEVFVRKDFFEIYDSIVQMGLVTRIFSNATLITDKVAKRLADAPPSRIDITLYGATRSVYETITRVTGSYFCCCKGIDNLVRHEIPIALRTTVTRQNFSELDAMRVMADNWGATLSVDWLLTQRRDRAASEAPNCRIPAKCGAMLENATRSIESLQRPHGNHGVERKTFFCYAGYCYFSITADGRINPCIDVSVDDIRPLDCGFSEAWDQLKKIVDSAPPLPEACTSCALAIFCSRCPAWSWTETGTLNQTVPYLCEVAAARKDLT